MPDRHDREIKTGAVPDARAAPVLRRARGCAAPVGLDSMSARGGFANANGRGENLGRAALQSRASRRTQARDRSR